MLNYEYGYAGMAGILGHIWTEMDLRLAVKSGLVIGGVFFSISCYILSSDLCCSKFFPHSDTSK